MLTLLTLTVVERFQVQSRSPFEIHQLLTRLEKTPETTVDCELYLPEGEGPFGCVVALHGSLGWADHHQDHINGWLNAGLAVCKINSFISRSIETTVDDQLTVTHAMMLVDAFAPVQYWKRTPKLARSGFLDGALEEPLLCIRHGFQSLTFSERHLMRIYRSILQPIFDLTSRNGQLRLS